MSCRSGAPTTRRCAMLSGSRGRRGSAAMLRPPRDGSGCASERPSSDADASSRRLPCVGSRRGAARCTTAAAAPTARAGAHRARPLGTELAGAPASSYRAHGPPGRALADQIPSARRVSPCQLVGRGAAGASRCGAWRDAFVPGRLGGRQVARMCSRPSRRGSRPGIHPRRCVTELEDLDEPDTSSLDLVVARALPRVRRGQVLPVRRRFQRAARLESAKRMRRLRAGRPVARAHRADVWSAARPPSRRRS